MRSASIPANLLHKAPKTKYFPTCSRKRARIGFWWLRWFSAARLFRAQHRNSVFLKRRNREKNKTKKTLQKKEPLFFFFFFYRARVAVLTTLVTTRKKKEDSNRHSRRARPAVFCPKSKDPRCHSPPSPALLNSFLAQCRREKKRKLRRGLWGDSAEA